MSTEMPQKLKWKLMDLAQEKTTKHHTARRPWVVAGLTAGFAALALAAYMFSPKEAVAKSWTLVKQAVDQVRSFQMIVHSPDQKQDVRIATADGKMRVDTDEGGIVYMDGASIQVYEPKENTVTRIKFPGVELGQIAPDIVGSIASHMDLKNDLARFEHEYGKENIQIGNVYSKDGRQVYDVKMHDPKGPGEAFLTIDAATDLPIYIRAHDPGEKDGDVEMSLRYNDRIEMTPNFPANVTYEDVDLGNLKSLGIDPEKISKEISEGISKGMSEGLSGKKEKDASPLKKD